MELGPESDIVLPDFTSTFDVFLSSFNFDVDVELVVEVEVEVRSISTFWVDDAVLVVAELWRDTVFVFVFVCVACFAEDVLLPEEKKKMVGRIAEIEIKKEKKWRQKEKRR